MRKKEKKLICCICGKEIKGFGNNPWGVLGKDGKLVEWKADDCCCDTCNGTRVIPDRIRMILRNTKKYKK